MVVVSRSGGLGYGGWMGPDRRLVEQQGVPDETRVPLAALGVEDPERRPATRRAVAVVGDERFGALADDVAAQADPRPAGQLEPDPRRFVDRGRQPAAGHAGGTGRIEDQQQDLRAPGERGEPMEPVGDPARLVGPGQTAARQVEDEQVDRAAGEQRARDAQPLVEGGRGDDDQPLEPDAAGDGLDRIEAARQVQPGDDRALRLGLGGDPQGEGGAAARAVAADRDAGRGGEAAGTEDRVERGEAGVDDPLAGERHRRRLGCQGQRTDDSRSCRTPAGLEAREGGVHITSGGRHRTAILEHLFYSINPDRPLGYARSAASRAGAGRVWAARATRTPSQPGHAKCLASAPTMLPMPATTPEPRPERPILVVDDDAKIVRLVRTYLEREGYAVVAAADGPAALDAIETHRPALVVLDLMLPELDGRAVIRAVRRDDEAAATPIIILSARGSTIDRIAGLEDGADDYLPKPFSPAELVLRVKSILRRAAPADASTATRPPLVHGDLTLDRDRFEVTRDGRPVPLTRVEFRLLETILAADGRVLTRDQLLDAVYGDDGAEILDRTIDVHVGRLRDKLGDDPDRPRYVATVRGVGYRAARTGRAT
jgi:DNA-binding response OmpR family regulator